MSQPLCVSLKLKGFAAKRIFMSLTICVLNVVFKESNEIDEIGDAFPK